MNVSCFAFRRLIERALVGRPAFTGSRPEQLERAGRGRRPPNPSRWVRLPEDVRLALRVGLAEDPDRRYQSAGELAVAFEEAFERRLSPELSRRAARLSWAR